MAPVHSSGRLMGLVGAVALAVMFLACVLTLPWTMGRVEATGARRYEATDLSQILLPPSWAGHAPDEAARREDVRARKRHLAWRFRT